MNLKEQTIKAFMWVTSARAVSQAFSWIVTILLARVLLPADFGLIALAWVIVGFLDLINELGIGAAIVQKKDLTADDADTMFWVSAAAGGLYYAAAWGLAPLVAWFFGKEELTALIRVLSLTVIFGGLRTIPFNLLTKDLAFSKRSIAESAGVVTGGGVSVGLALSGYGVWSLVTGTLIQQALLSLLVFAFSAYRPRLCFAVERARGLLRFGATIMSSRILWYAYNSSDSLIVGKLLGEQSLGYYSMAVQLSMLPVQKITGIVNQVAFPVFSKLQGQDAELTTYFLKITRFVALLTFPAMMGLFLVSDSLINVLLTDKWLPAVGIFKLLCVVGALKSIDTIIPNLLMAKGKAAMIVRYTTINILVLPAAFFLGAHWGLTGLGYAWLATYPIVSTYVYSHGLREAGVSFGQYLSNLRPAVMASLVMAIGVLVFQTADGLWYGRNVYVTILGACVVGAAAYLACLASFHQDVVSEVRDVMLSMRARPQMSRG